MALSKFVACTIGAVAVLTAAACADGTGKALTPTLPTASSTAANPDGTQLKATVPVATSPSSGRRVSNLTPEFSLTNGAGNYDPNATLSYQFQVLEGTTVVAESQMIAAGSPQTLWAAPADVLKHNKTYTWRARAAFGGVLGSWSDMSTFLTPLPPPPPSTSPGPVFCAGSSGPGNHSSVSRRRIPRSSSKRLRAISAMSVAPRTWSSSATASSRPANARE